MKKIIQIYERCLLLRFRGNNTGPLKEGWNTSKNQSRKKWWCAVSLRSRNSTVTPPIQPIVVKPNHCSTHPCEVKSLLFSKYICVQKGCIRNSLQKASGKAFNRKLQCETHLSDLRWNNVLQYWHLVSMRCKFWGGGCILKGSHVCSFFFLTGNGRIAETACMRPRHVWIHEQRLLHRFSDQFLS